MPAQTAEVVCEAATWQDPPPRRATPGDCSWVARHTAGRRRSSLTAIARTVLAMNTHQSTTLIDVRRDFTMGEHGAATRVLASDLSERLRDT
jgi:hypothetical protein